MSVGASGSAFPHAAISTRSGRGIDPGKSGLKSTGDRILDLVAKAVRERKLPTANDLAEIRAMRRIHGREIADRKYLLRHGIDAFESAFDRPNASVVYRPENLSGVSDKALEKVIADTKSVGYSKPGAVSAGLKRLLSPFRSPTKMRELSCLLDGTFCSSGANRVLQSMGLPTASSASTLPADLMKHPNLSLLGIGVNRSTMEAVKGLRGHK